MDIEEFDRDELNETLKAQCRLSNEHSNMKVYLMEDRTFVFIVEGERDMGLSRRGQGNYVTVATTHGNAKIGQDDYRYGLTIFRPPTPIKETPPVMLLPRAHLAQSLRALKENPKQWVTRNKIFKLAGVEYVEVTKKVWLTQSAKIKKQG